MRKHCCICGAKAPRSISGSPWLSVRADNDPAHIFCPEHKDGEGMKHVHDWRARRIGCRISPDPDETEWKPEDKNISREVVHAGI